MPALNYREYIRKTTINSMLFFGGLSFALMLLVFLNDGYYMWAFIMGAYAAFISMICFGLLAFFSSISVVIGFKFLSKELYPIHTKSDLIVNILFMLAVYFLSFFILITFGNGFPLTSPPTLPFIMSLVHVFTVQELLKAPRKHKEKA